MPMMTMLTGTAAGRYSQLSVTMITMLTGTAAGRFSQVSVSDSDNNVDRYCCR